MSEDFSRAIVAQAIARACVAWGFKETSSSCIRPLTDIVQRYIIWLGERAVEYAEVSGRSHTGINDFFHAYGEVKTLRDFAFSDVKNPDVNPRWNQPFHYDVPEFPVRKKSRQSLREDVFETSVRGANVPDHLPMFPPRHTYSRKAKKLKTAVEQKDVYLKTIENTKSIQNTLAKIEGVDDL